MPHYFCAVRTVASTYTDPFKLFDTSNDTNSVTAAKAAIHDNHQHMFAQNRKRPSAPDIQNFERRRGVLVADA